MNRLYLILSLLLFFVLFPVSTSIAMTDEEMIDYAILQYDLQKGSTWHDINDDMHYLISYPPNNFDTIYLCIAHLPADANAGIQQGILGVWKITDGYPVLAQWYNDKFERPYNYRYTISTNTWTFGGTAHTGIPADQNRFYYTNRDIDSFFLAPALPLNILMERNLTNLQPFLGGIASQVLPLCLKVLAILLSIALIIYFLRSILLKKQ